MFHSKVIKPTIINYKDITNSFDLNDLNYDKILDSNLNYLLRNNKVNKIFLFSNISLDKINIEKLVLIKIDINKGRWFKLPVHSRLKKLKIKQKI